MKCPLDECDGIINNNGTLVRIEMDYIKVQDCYICAWCGTEIWPNYKKGKVTTNDAREALRDEQRRQQQMRKKTSSRKAGRKRKAPPKIQAWWAREQF